MTIRTTVSRQYLEESDYDEIQDIPSPFLVSGGDPNWKGLRRGRKVKFDVDENGRLCPPWNGVYTPRRGELTEGGVVLLTR